MKVILSIHHEKKLTQSIKPQKELVQLIAKLNLPRKRRVFGPEQMIADFKAKIKFSDDYVCTCCHRLLFREAVMLLNKSIYQKVDPSVLDQVFAPKFEYVTTIDGHSAIYICRTCHSALSRGKMPLLSKANGLDFTPKHDIPKELSELNELETRLISLRIPFMKPVALPDEKHRKIIGPAVNIPSKLDTICNLLPSDPEILLLEFKRKVCYKGHYIYGHVSPQKLRNALAWIKLNNPLYENVIVNDG